MQYKRRYATKLYKYIVYDPIFIQNLLFSRIWGCLVMDITPCDYSLFPSCPRMANGKNKLSVKSYSK